MAFLASLPLFKGLDAATLARLAAVTTRHPLQRGAMLFRKGEPATGMYIVAYGEIKLLSTTPARGARLSGIVGPGQLYYTTDQQHEIPEGVAADDYYVERLLAPKLAIDLEYVERRTPWSDAHMVLATAGVMLRGLLGKGA